MIKPTTCQLCGRAITNAESLAKGVGPECEAKRQKYLAAAGSSDAEISELALCGDPTVSRWIHKAGCAMAAGKQDQVNLFLEAARRAKAVADTEALMASAKLLAALKEEHGWDDPLHIAAQPDCWKCAVIAEALAA